LTAEAEIGRSRFADGPSAVLSIEFQHAVGGGCAVRDLGFRFFAHVLPSSSGRPPARSRNVVLGGGEVDCGILIEIDLRNFN
jgi:hypothetical protein